jgi:hypothetical protein
MTERWAKLDRDLYKKDGKFDLSKLPDVYDNIRYDLLHNRNLHLDGMEKLYRLAKLFSDFVVPQEYGLGPEDKLHIGENMCAGLLRKIATDLNVTRLNKDLDLRYHLDMSHASDLAINSLERRVRTRLYFTSESHLHTLLNVFLYGNGNNFPLSAQATRILEKTPELGYMTQIVIRLYENLNRSEDDPKRWKVELKFSPGSAYDPLRGATNSSTVPLTTLNKNMISEQFENFLVSTADHSNVSADNYLSLKHPDGEHCYESGYYGMHASSQDQTKQGEEEKKADGEGEYKEEGKQ